MTSVRTTTGLVLRTQVARDLYRDYALGSGVDEVGSVVDTESRFAAIADHDRPEVGELRMWCAEASWCCSDGAADETTVLSGQLCDTRDGHHASIRVIPTTSNSGKSLISFDDAEQAVATGQSSTSPLLVAEGDGIQVFEDPT